MRKLAIIPARGGSKRIPRKNIKNFLGKPIIAYSIQAAIESKLFDEVMVSTDDDEIAVIAQEYGAKVPFFRSAQNADDQATTFDVISEVLNSYKEDNKHFEKACCIYPTAPFASASTLIKFYEFLDESIFDCVFPVLRYGYPIQRALRIKEQERVEMLHPENLNTRSQDLEPTYHDAGQFYWFRTEPLMKVGALWSNNTGVKVIDEMLAQDIDNEEDWKIAEFKYRILNQKL